jgi:hypothetical protein
MRSVLQPTDVEGNVPNKPVAAREALVCGAGGFIGHHLVKRLKSEGLWVRGADLKFPRFSDTEADDFLVGDLRDPYFVKHVVDRPFDEVYQLPPTWVEQGTFLLGSTTPT